MVAAGLARLGIGSRVVDGSGHEGRGTAHSTPEDAHLLDLVAGRMGAWADKPEDFAQAVAADGYQPQDFIPRRRCGEYLSNILHEALDGASHAGVEPVRSAKQTANGWQVGLADEVDGRSLIARAGRAWAVGPLIKARFWEKIQGP